MRKIVFLIVIISSVWGCTNNIPDQGNTSNPGTDITVNLISTDNPTIFSKSVIILDNVQFLIKTPFNTFLSGYPFKLAGYADLKTKAINDGILKDTLYLSDYLKSSSDSIQTIAYYLETGNCYFFDKQSQAVIQTIHYQNYEDDSAVDTRFGRKFYIDRVLFLETVDSIRIIK